MNYYLLAFIEKNTWSGLEDFYSNLVRAIHAEMLHKGSSKQGRRKSKKRKNGKSMQHQTSTVTSNDNEDDDDDEDVDDIRTNSNGKNFIFNGNESQGQDVHPLYFVSNLEGVNIIASLATHLEELSCELSPKNVTKNAWRWRYN